MRQSVKVVTNCRIPGKGKPVQLHLGYLSLKFEGGIPDGQRKKLQKNLRRLWLKYFQSDDVDINWPHAEGELTKHRDVFEHAVLSLERRPAHRGRFGVMGTDGGSTRFCCGACEHVAGAADREPSYSPSPAVFVHEDGSGAVLVALRGQDRRSIPLARGMRATIGRDRSCDLWFDDKMLSLRTCELRVSDAGDVFIEDLNSTCGTVVNDARTAGPYRLHQRDAIRIGSMVLVFANP